MLCFDARDFINLGVKELYTAYRQTHLFQNLQSFRQNWRAALTVRRKVSGPKSRIMAKEVISCFGLQGKTYTAKKEFSVIRKPKIKPKSTWLPESPNQSENAAIIFECLYHQACSRKTLRVPVDTIFPCGRLLYDQSKCTGIRNPKTVPCYLYSPCVLQYKIDHRLVSGSVWQKAQVTTALRTPFRASRACLGGLNHIPT